MNIPVLVLGILIGIPNRKQKIKASLYNLMGLVCGSGWWIAIVEFVSPNQRPYIGGSPTNDFLELTFPYNGIDRFIGVRSKDIYDISRKLTQESSLSHSRGGVSRFLWSFEATQIGLLSSITFLGIVLEWYWLHHYCHGTSAQKLFHVVMSSWFITFWLIFSYMGGTFHPYYPLILAHPMAFLSTWALVLLWNKRNQWWIKKLFYG